VAVGESENIVKKKKKKKKKKRPGHCKEMV
jgi:hypothetical protein